MLSWFSRNCEASAFLRTEKRGILLRGNNSVEKFQRRNKIGISHTHTRDTERDQHRGVISRSVGIASICFQLNYYAPNEHESRERERTYSILDRRRIEKTSLSFDRYLVDAMSHRRSVFSMQNVTRSYSTGTLVIKIAHLHVTYHDVTILRDYSDHAWHLTFLLVDFH